MDSPFKRYKERSLTEFQKAFPDDQSCADHLAEQRWTKGYICPKCGHKESWYLKNRRHFDCKKCRFQTSITAGTIFHGTKVPLIKWYWLIYHMAMNKVGVSVLEMQRILNIGQYRTIWLMAHKIRKAMAERDAKYKLAGLVEMDESFFGPADRGGKRGRGSETKMTVLCAVSLYTDREGKERPGFANMSVVNDASAKSIEEFLKRLGMGPETKDTQHLLEAIRSDGWRSYGKVSRSHNLEHCKVVLKEPKNAGKLLPWVHRIISNAKSVMRGAHRGVSKKHLQGYLNEFCYRFNRRFWEKELFERLVQACVSAKTITYNELIS